jgi:hypothetical protein
MVDFYFYNYAFAKQQSFSHEKISTFFAIMKRNLGADIKHNSKGDVSFERFQESILKHAVERPPASVGIFSTEDVRAMVDYVTDK